MRTFMAGAIRIGSVVASSTVEARSSACPPAIRAIRFAVAGAATDHVGVARQADVADVGLVLAIEQVGVRPLSRERRCGERGHELLRALRENAAHRSAALAQAADQVERLVGRDAAADDEQDALGFQT